MFTSFFVVIYKSTYAMIESETANTHLHKVLSQRNHMHNVALQKQLNIYDRQKKLVEKELLQITKVRSAVQQINKRLPKKSPRIKKRKITSNCSSENSKHNPPSVTETGKDVHERKEILKEQRVIENGKIGQSNVNEMKFFGPKDENIDHHATQSPVTAAINNQVQAKLKTPPQENNHPSKIIDAKIPAEMEERKLFTQRKPPYVKSFSAPHLPVQKLEVVKNEGNEQCDVYRLPKTPTNIDPYENPDEDLYRKSLLTNHANKGNKESQIKPNQCNDHFCLPKTSTSVTKEEGYANSDLNRKSPLTCHTNPETKLPALTNHQLNGCHGSEINKMNSLGKNLHGSESVQKRNRNFLNSAFPNTDVCLVQKSRSKTVCEQKPPKSKSAWNSPGTQRRQVSNTLVNFPNNDVCVMDRPRTRTKKICDMESQFSKYGRPRSKTESGHTHPGCQQGSARNLNWLPENTRPRSTTVSGTNDWQKNGIKRVAGLEYCRNLSISSESLAITEDESIAIKGKFRQIGHSVLATALMKKMGKK